MASITLTPLGNNLQQFLCVDDLLPGDAPSYEACKAVYLSHPLGGKIAESPVRLAQSQDREITAPGGPEELLIERFNEEWRVLEASDVLLNLKTQARVYGLTSVALGEVGKDQASAIDLKDLWKSQVYFNVFDPLNTSGLIVDQNPNSPTFQKRGEVYVNGQRWHRSRTRTVQNEFSIFIAWTSSAFSFSGRSTYQRAWYPLKSFVNTMVVDDMVARKAGLIVAKMEQPGSVVDRIMMAMANVKRFFLKAGQTNDILGIGTTESVEALNLTNVDAALREARNDIIKNIATAVDMPAKLLTQESYVEGFGEGTEDAHAVAQYIDRLRIEMAPEYAWMDTIVQRRAWNPEWYQTVQERYPEDYASVDYEAAFYGWRNSFKATWPNLIREEPSQLAIVDEIKLKSALATVQILAPLLAAAPDQLVKVVEWFTSTVNVNETLFEGDKLDLDFDDLLSALEDQRDKQAEMQEKQLEQTENAGVQRPFSGHDSAGVEFLSKYINEPRGPALRSNLGSFARREIRHAPSR